MAETFKTVAETKNSNMYSKRIVGSEMYV